MPGIRGFLSPRLSLESGETLRDRIFRSMRQISIYISLALLEVEWGTERSDALCALGSYLCGVWLLVYTVGAFGCCQ
eukprot:IDg10696t1